MFLRRWFGSGRGRGVVNSHLLTPPPAAQSKVPGSTQGRPGDSWGLPRDDETVERRNGETVKREGAWHPPVSFYLSFAR